MNPVISCIMSNFNTDPAMLRQALNSILNQTFKEFELILIDDKSTNKDSKNVIKEYAAQDKRIIPIYNDKNMGLAESLNVGLDIAKGDYIARFDTDDICVRDRFDRQLKYMKKIDADICSTFSHLFGNQSGVVSTCFTDSKSVAAQLLFSCYIYHTPVMMKRSFLVNHKLKYDVEFEGAEDFDLFSRSREAGGNICIMPEVMFHYRMHNDSVCHTKNTKQKELCKKICSRQLDNMRIKYDSNEWMCHQVLCNLSPFSLNLYSDINKWCEKLIQINNKNRVFEDKAYAKVIYNRFFSAIMKSDYSLRIRLKYIIANKKLCTWSNFYSVLYKKGFALKYRLRGRKK